MCLEGTTPQDIPHHCISDNQCDRLDCHLSISTIRVYFCDDNRNNLRQLSCLLRARRKSLEIFLSTNCTNQHEFSPYNLMATGSVALICTNAMRVWMIEAGPVAYCLSLRFSAALGKARTSSALRSLARKFVRLVRPIRSPFYSLKGISVNS